MKSLRLWLVVIGAFTISGCANFGTSGPFESDRYVNMLEEGEFTQAERYLEKLVVEDDPERKALRKQLDKAKLAYEKDTLKQANSARKSNEWLKAQGIYQQGLEALPNSEKLQNSFFTFLTQKEAYISKLEKKHALNRAKVLPKELSLNEKLLAVHPSDRTLKREIKRLRAEALELSVYFDGLAEASFESGKFTKAKQYDALVLSLVDSKVSRERIASANKALDQVAQRNARSQLAKKQKQFDEQWRLYEEAVSSGDYLAARRWLEKLQSFKLHSNTLDKESARLTVLINSKADKLIQKGKQQYTRGQLEDAIASWKSALELKPGDQSLVAQIKRAEIFHANYQRLSN